MDTHDHEQTVESVIRNRRSNLRIDPDRNVEESTIRELIELATWAPNHHRTNPWRFAVFTGSARERLGQALAKELAARGATGAKVTKTATKYLRAPAILIVGAATGTTLVESVENRYAVAAGIQNVLLGATGRGLATLWGSLAVPNSPAARECCGFEQETEILGLIYLGYPTEQVAVPERLPAHIAWRRSIDDLI